MVRFVSALAFALSLSLIAAPEAFAKPKPDDGAAAPAAADAYAIPEMKITKIPEIDSFFETAKAPITSLVNTRKMVDAAKDRINTSLGLATGTSFSDALANLNNKAGAMVSIATNTGKMPALHAKDAVPPDIQHAIDEFNGAMADLDTASDQLKQVTGELTTLAQQASELPGKVPDAAKSAGLSMTDQIAATKNTGTNVKTVGGAKDEAEKLGQSLAEIGTSITSTFH
jgi:hypothetical protein